MSTDKAALPRGIRNCNPGNLRKTSDPWQGLADSQPDPEFFTFKGPTWGIRALARTLITYRDRWGLRTIRAVIGRWAPPVENDTGSYAEHVARRMNRSVDGEINPHDYNDLRPLVEAIIRHENGMQPYTAAQIDKGLVLAGVEPPAPENLAKSRTVKGGQVGAVGGVVATATAGLEVVASSAPEIRAHLATLEGILPWAGTAAGVVTLISIGWMLYARWDDRRRGLR